MFCYNIPFQNSGTGSLGVAAAGGAFFSFFTFATPLLIHWVSKKYVTELLYNKIEDSYTAITYSLLLKKKKVSLNLKSSKSKLKSESTMSTKVHQVNYNQISFLGQFQD